MSFRDHGLDNDVRVAVYRYFIENGRPPLAGDLAADMGLAPVDVEDSYRRLAEAHVLVLAPGTPYIWMANPLSALPSPFEVEALGKKWWGVCIWDALGIIAMLGGDGTVSTRCPDCAEPLRVSVNGGEVSGDGVVHYAVPAAHWWDDIGFN